MHPTVSNAEWDVRIDLTLLRDRLEKASVHMEYQKQIVLDATTMDAYAELSNGEKHCFLLDGPVHLKSEKVKLRDEYVEQVLQKRHYKIHRYPYVPPLSKEKLAEIEADILKALGVKMKNE
jgi:hypothetical protein